MAEHQKKPSSGLYRNLVSYLGGLVMLGAGALILLSMLAEFSIEKPGPYIGIIAYLILPGILGVGGVMVLWGMRREAVRRKRTGEFKALPYPVLDLNDDASRKRFGYGLVIGSLFLVLLAWAGYNGFVFTESVSFCGTTCHTVMEPEHTAYLYSPHARVRCVDCHVGEGANWYVKSKLSGVRQVFAVVFHTYETPIPTPISNLRPARETCEHCHWPRKFWGARLLQLPHFRYDEKNSPEQISLMLKVGGGETIRGEGGIHWHMVINNQVTFAATDKQLQHIPWIKIKHADGSEVEFVDQDTKLTPDQIKALPKHDMDCMDCHNRPSHQFPAPEGGVDDAIYSGKMSITLPWIKKVAVDALTRGYPDRDSAHAGMRQEITDFYKNKYPDIAQQRQADIDKAIEAAITLYDRSVFPQMKVDWKTYPMNVGHRNWPGCFRCHDGKHVSTDGQVVPMKCDGTCHSMPQRSQLAGLGQVGAEPTSDWHPWEMPAKGISVKAHERLLCSECHSAGYRPKRDCNDCHATKN